MKHLTDEERLAFIEGRVTNEAADHLKTCADCDAEIRAMRQSIDRLQRLEWPGRLRRRRANAPFFRWAAAAALILCAGFLAGRASGPNVDEIKTQVAKDVRESLRKELLASLPAQPPQPPAEIVTLLTEIREQQNANYLSLRSDLETLASNADARLRAARTQLLELASRTQ